MSGEKTKKAKRLPKVFWLGKGKLNDEAKEKILEHLRKYLLKQYKSPEFEKEIIENIEHSLSIVLMAKRGVWKDQKRFNVTDYKNLKKAFEKYTNLLMTLDHHTLSFAKVQLQNSALDNKIAQEAKGLHLNNFRDPRIMVINEELRLVSDPYAEGGIKEIIDYNIELNSYLIYNLLDSISQLKIKNCATDEVMKTSLHALVSKFQEWTGKKSIGLKGPLEKFLFVVFETVGREKSVRQLLSDLKNLHKF